MGGRGSKFLQSYGNGKFREEKGKEPSLPDTEYERCIVYILDFIHVSWLIIPFPKLATETRVSPRSIMEILTSLPSCLGVGHKEIL